METILSAELRRRLYIVTSLHLARDWVSLDSIRQEMRASRQTVFSDLKYFEDNWQGALTVEYQKSKGLKLTLAPDWTIHDIYTGILKTAPAYLLMEAIFFNPQESLQHWQKEFFLSQSSIYRLTQKISDVLQARGLKLKRQPLAIIGRNERHLRFFYKRFFLEMYGFHGWPFEIDRKAIVTVSEKLREHFGWDYGNAERSDLAFGIAVNLYRIAQGHLIKKIQLKSQKQQELVAGFSKFEADFEGLLPDCVDGLPEGWAQDFAYSLMWWDFAWDNPQELINISEQANYFIDTITAEADLTMDEASRKKLLQFIVSLYGLYKTYPFARNIFYNRGWFSKTIIEQHLNVLPEIIANTAKELEKRYKIPWYSRYYQDLLVRTCMYWDDLMYKVNQTRKKIRILILSDLGKYHSDFIANFLSDFFGEVIITKASIEFIDEVGTADFDEVDIILANYRVTNDKNAKVLVIDDIPSDKDLAELRQRVEDLRLIRQ